MNTKRACKSLTISEKLKVIAEVERGTKSKKEIAANFGIPPSTLSTILKNKNSILKAGKSAHNERKRAKSSSFPDVEEAMIKWMKSVREQNLPVSGTILREKAEQFAASFQHTEFKASTGWLDKFKQRNGLLHKAVCGESFAVSNVECDKWKDEILPNLIKDYDPKDIFNADETALFYKCLPDKTLAFKNEKCYGGKRSKDRVTVMVGANMTGTEKLKLLVIGKSKKPRCFSKVKSLPVDYVNNSKSWMTSTIFEDWLKKIDRKFQHQNRKVILFIDNCPAHSHFLTTQLKATKVEFFPPNATSKLQPMDQGVIKNLKHYYRKRTVLKMIRKMDKNESFDITLLDAILELDGAWRDVTSKTIFQCFRKAGFNEGNGNSDIISDEEDDIPLSMLEWSTFKKAVKCDADFDEYVNVDSQALVAQYPTTSDIIQSVRMESGNGCDVVSESDSEEDSTNGNSSENVFTVPSASDAIKAMDTVKTFVISQQDVDEDIFKSLNAIDKFCILKQRDAMKQMKITDFFK